MYGRTGIAHHTARQERGSTGTGRYEYINMYSCTDALTGTGARPAVQL